MEVNLNFILFEELQEKSDSNEAVAHIVILRESKDSCAVLEDGGANYFPLE